jgi:hypothetical protein
VNARKTVRVAVCGPGDVSREKETVHAVVREFDSVWGEYLGVHAEAVEWRTHAWPGADQDAQGRINSTVLREYDILVAAMWSRFGSPTARADSGTLEELEEAFVRAGENANVAVFVYFNHEKIDPFSLNPSQHARVCAFRSELVERKILFWDYEGAKEFEAAIRGHLSREIQRRVISLPPAPIAITRRS